MSPETRSRLMSRIRGKDTVPELTLADAILKKRVKLERHAKDLPGRPDFVVRKFQLAIFVDGSFWHGWRFPLWKHKLSPKWQKKISDTRARDRRNFARLRRQDWKVLRIWEHQIERDVDACVARIIVALNERRNGKT